MKKNSKFLYGGDYNPNQWDEKIWKEDFVLFREAKINSVTVNVFSWAKIQPSEDTYDFSVLDEIITQLTKERVKIVLATSTAALPAWMFKKYPEVGRTDFDGRKHIFGQRHNACPNSLIYQKYAKRLASKLAERYSNNPQLAYWHVNNEYGGECFCENCTAAFRVWVQNKYKTISELNRAWNLEFWGHTIYEWDEIVLPNALSEGISYEKTAFAGISIDYRRFNSESMLNNFKMEREEIRKFDSETPITTNFMGTYRYLDYFKWAKEMDIVSWDNYPAYNTPWSLTAMRHDLMRSLKKAPFMLMEQTPSQQNWQPYNSLKKPGQMRAQSYQTIAHGGDTIQFFQLRQSAGGCEKFHGAVIAHNGTNDTRVFKEVKNLGEELEHLGEYFISTITKCEVGIMFDWDNYWALEYTSGPNKDLSYVDQIHRIYEYFYKKNISVDFINENDDFSKYKLIVAPVLYMVKDGIIQSIEYFVEQGGVFVTTYMSGIVDQSDNVYLGGYPGPLRALTGIWIEEIDALAPEQRNEVFIGNQHKGEGTLVSDIIHLEGAKTLATYNSNFYKGSPAATVHSFGHGKVYYMGTQFDFTSLCVLFDQIIKNSTISDNFSESELEICSRYSEDTVVSFIINLTQNTQPLPKAFIGTKDNITSVILDKDFVFEPFDVVIVKQSLHLNK